MAIPDPHARRQHPLLDDVPRLEAIADAMYSHIHKKLGWAPPPRRSNPLRVATRSPNRPPDRVLPGSNGVSPDDILSLAVCGLVACDPDDLEDTWESLGVRIAENKTVDALKTAGAGLRATPKRPELRLVSGDDKLKPISDPEGEGVAIFDTLAGHDPSPEQVFEQASATRELRRLARDLLTPRDEKIFVGLHFGLSTRKELGDELELTVQRVGQIYRDAQKSIWAHPRNPYQAIDDKET